MEKKLDTNQEEIADYKNEIGQLKDKNSVLLMGTMKKKTTKKLENDPNMQSFLKKNDVKDLKDLVSKYDEVQKKNEELTRSIEANKEEMNELLSENKNLSEQYKKQVEDLINVTKSEAKQAEIIELQKKIKELEEKHIEEKSNKGKSLNTSDNESPVFLRWIGDTKYATDGTRAELSVTVKGNPINGPAWYLNNKRIESRDHRKIETSTDNSGNKISKIILDPCCTNDGGDYLVIADNKLGKTKCGAKRIILDAKSAPQFISGLRNKKVKPGDTVTFSVTVVGSPQPKVEWTNKREFINKYDHVDVTDVVENGSLTSKLNIHNVSDIDEGLISVTARNDISSTFCDAQLTLDKT